MIVVRLYLKKANADHESVFHILSLATREETTLGCFSEMRISKLNFSSLFLFQISLTC